MIPDDTPPGADVVCLDATPLAPFIPYLLVTGAVHSLRAWVLCTNPLTGEIQRGVVLNEIDHPYAAFGPERFRLLDLPRELTSLLEAAPVKERERV